ncbi:cytosolic endo-beta-N-acetylglucosaminidase [Ascaphus truei]|uniref:cytosolic endo-beta-N-acetylglucosaminidase n=1 Tax=Ascaphus truei TaxID=8439 RepID=UPI003F5AB4A0
MPWGKDHVNQHSQWGYNLPPAPREILFAHLEHASRSCNPYPCTSTGPHHARSTSPHHTCRTGPHHARSTGPHHARSTSPHHTCRTGPHHTRSAGPHHARSTSPHHARSTGPHHTRSTGPHHTRSTGPHHTRSTSPHHARSTGPHHTRSTGPHHAGSTGPHHARSAGPHHARSTGSQHSHSTGSQLTRSTNPQHRPTPHPQHRPTPHPKHRPTPSLQHRLTALPQHQLTPRRQHRGERRRKCCAWSRQSRHHDRETTEPISFFLSNLEELLSWKPTNQDSFNIAVTPLAKRHPPMESQRPRTLVCHDMMGGYLEDRFIQGSDARDPYVFYHWQHIDIFVYFSHRMFTLPPVCWTNAAHKHGVCVLGTFITEWDEGGKTCESFLAGEESAYRAVADQMVWLAQFYQFDGWLVNIENVLSPVAVSRTPLFLRYLTEQLHLRVPGGQILWYDSVVQDGALQWQNELNDNNRRFFDACDGIFTNYNWREEHAQRMASEPRRADVYIGVDIFARGEVVGGKFDTFKSLQVIRQHGLSAALFAPGWVYECLEKEEFLQNQHKFWALLERHLPTHSLCALPVSSSFCLGFGKKRFSYGEGEDVGPWCNLSAQEMQPIFLGVSPSEGPGGWVRSRSCPRDAWHGGNSLLIEGTLPADTSGVTVRLFSLLVPAPPKLLLFLVYKLEGTPNVAVSLELRTRDSPSCSVESIVGLTEQSKEQSLQLLSEPPLLLTDAQQQGKGSWKQRYYEVELSGCILTSLSVRLSRLTPDQQEENFTCRLGEIRVLDVSLPPSLPQQPTDLSLSHLRWRRDPQSGQLYASLTLRWSHPTGTARHFRIYCRGVTCHREPPSQPHLLGLAHACVYRVVDLAVPDPCPPAPGWLEFAVQPVGKDGLGPLPPAWGQLVLEYTEQTHTEV